MSRILCAWSPTWAIANWRRRSNAAPPSGSSKGLPSPLRGGAGGGGARAGISKLTPPSPTPSPQGGRGFEEPPFVLVETVRQVRRLAAQTGQAPSNVDGTGVTDPPTLQLALTAANRVSHEILEGLAAIDLRGACGNAIVAHPAGILHGIDHQWTGKVERIDTALLRALLDNDIVPVIPPLGCDGEGHTYRLNSDAVAAEVARSLNAVKLVYLTSAPGIVLSGQLLRQLSVEEAAAILKQHRAGLPGPMVSRLDHAVRATRAGVPRVHIIDGRVEEGLLAEVFSNEGIGTLVHAAR